MAGVKIGDTTISIGWSDRAGDDSRSRYHYWIDTPDFEYNDDDLQSGRQGGDLQEGMESLLSFLGACAESIDYQTRTEQETENTDLFPAHIGEWACENSDEISMLQCEIEENKELIVEV